MCLHYQATIILGVQDLGVTPSLSQSGLVSSTTISFKAQKNIFGHTSESKNSYPEAELQNPKIKISAFRDFPRFMN